MKRLHLCRLAVAPLVLAAACVPDDALTPKVQPTLGAALADVSHPALDYVAKWFSGGIGIPTILPTRCPLESASQSFVCAPLVSNGHTLVQRFTLLDAAGGKQTAFDPATTTTLHLENSVSGGGVDGQQVLDLTGLGSTSHTLNGASLTLKTSGDPISPYETEWKATITDLVFPVVAGSGQAGWPLSGTIDVRSRATNRPDNPAVFIATYRFSGSSVVTLTLTVPGGIQTCQVNLAAMPGLGCTPDGPAIPVVGDALPRETPALR
jgi:hypothetical protein